MKNYMTFILLIGMSSLKGGRGGEAFGGAMFGSMTGSLIAGAATRNSGGGGDQSGYVLKRLDRLENALEDRVQEIERFVQKSIESLNRQMAALRKSLGQQDLEATSNNDSLDSDSASSGTAPAVVDQNDSGNTVAASNSKKGRPRQMLRSSRRARRKAE